MTEPIKLTIELSEEELNILSQLAKEDGVTPSEALKKSIIKAGYLRQQTTSGNKIIFGKLEDGKITGTSNLKAINVDRF